MSRRHCSLGGRPGWAIVLAAIALLVPACVGRSDATGAVLVAIDGEWLVPPEGYEDAAGSSQRFEYPRIGRPLTRITVGQPFLLKVAYSPVGGNAPRELPDGRQALLLNSIITIGVSGPMEEEMVVVVFPSVPKALLRGDGTAIEGSGYVYARYAGTASGLPVLIAEQSSFATTAMSVQRFSAKPTNVDQIDVRAWGWSP